MRQNSMAYGKNKFQKEEKISPPAQKRARKHHVSNHKNAPNHQRQNPTKEGYAGRSIEDAPNEMPPA